MHSTAHHTCHRQAGFPRCHEKANDIKQIITAKLKLLPTKTQQQRLRQTQLAYRDALNAVSHYAFAHGKTILAGQAVLFVLGAANHDPAQFVNPDQLDLRRYENRHVAFGHGIHYCIGSPLARLEGEIAFSTLAARLHNPHLETAQPEWFPSAVFRGLNDLEISFS